ncbi:hypothetical protein TBLA_0E00290 [Henningerozyma blattae CBS 6284]|uniref:Exocyst complex component SEC15 n=1 Tax=Henningerozyma blattae (strain ATCC 34711 / CBS 6284 / DSM 70876 / NBRC 10599 / NRRL Y-10934 / UCD 77-7) TaxID=1071380 RepID=I2H3Y9_HENB6|nr:hypothetical protein TBLA_0E00290 [Tetrapisispora blattae CBS 6284]CCH61091.1 hypothetical protein TBLA_0E00290 [Tetrapisispora blattae CBS 6284]
MDQETQYKLSQNLQKVLLLSAPTTVNALVENEKKIKNKDSHNISEKAEYLGDEIFDLDSQLFDKWVPFLRTAIENEQLPTLIDDLYTSIDENFQGLETQIIQESHINDKLKSSIREISNVQDMITNTLTSEITGIQSQLSKSTTETIIKKQIFVNNKKSSLKISEASILINKILKILELSNKCQELIEDGKFFKALQNLDNLEKIYLQEFRSYDFDILKQIYDTIPFLKLTIRNECINIIRNSFNSNLGKNLPEVGKTIFNIYDKELFNEWKSTKESMKLHNFMFNSPVEISLRNQDTLSKLQLDKFFNLDEFHDSILIFESLNGMDTLLNEFSNEYKFRKDKIIHPLIWKKSQSSSQNINPGDILNDSFTQKLNMEFLKDYLWKILGFLLYDINLNQSTNFSLVNNNYSTTNDFWLGIVSRLQPYLKHLCYNIIKKESEIEEFKDFFSMYIAILENFKLSTDLLYSLLLKIFENYCVLTIKSFGKEFINLLKDDDFMPLTINDKKLYQKIKRICWMKEEDEQLNGNQEDGQLMINFPFSPLYPMTCTLLRKTYTKLISFVDNAYRHELHKVNNILVKTIDSILNDTVNKQIRSKLDTTSREELAQILINLDYFIIASTEFSNIMTKDNIMQNPDIEIRLSAIKNFTTSREYAEDNLIKLIDTKISDILETVSLDWETSEIRNSPDFSIVDVAQFLEMMFASTLVNLPYSVQTLLIFREFDSLSSQFLHMLLYETPDQISEESVLNFEVDIQFLKSIIPRVFPGANTVNNTEEDQSRMINNIKSLESTFIELDQCISLLKSSNPLDYRDPQMRMRKYPRVKQEYASSLINKVRRSEILHSGSNTPSESINSASRTPDENQSIFDMSSNNKAIANFFNRK